jgi:hypothetical protein
VVLCFELVQLLLLLLLESMAVEEVEEQEVYYATLQELLEHRHYQRLC